jgi:hypothetical protein
MSTSNGKPKIAARQTTDPVPHIPNEFPALRRVREGVALERRLEREREVERAGGPKARSW